MERSKPSVMANIPGLSDEARFGGPISSRDGYHGDEWPTLAPTLVMGMGIVAGALAGLVGTWAMSEAQRLWTAIRRSQRAADMTGATGRSGASIGIRTSWHLRLSLATFSAAV